MAVRAATSLALMMLLLVGSNLGADVVRSSWRSDNCAVGEGSATTGNDEAVTSIINMKRMFLRGIFWHHCAFFDFPVIDLIGTRVSEASEA